MDVKIEIEDHTGEIIRNKDEAVSKALEMIGLQCEKYAKMICPVDTGRLRNSLTHEVRESEECVYVGTNVEYAPYVEYGTSRSRAQPYLKPAIEEHKEEYKSIAESCFNFS